MNNEQPYIETQDLALASVLLALGIPFCTDTPFLKARTQWGDRYKFFFQEVSNCGKFRTMEMIHAWNTPTFHEDNPEHPLAYMKCAYENKEGLLDKVNQGLDLCVVKKNGKIAVMSKNASEETKQKLISQL